MRSFALVVVLCTGCDQLFDIHAIDVPHADARGDADSPHDGSAGAPACSRMTMLADDFSSDDLATMWPQSTALSTNQFVVRGGQLEIQSIAADSYATLDAARFYDLRGTWFSARITDDGNVDANDFIQLEILSETGYDLKIARNNTTVEVVETVPHGNPITIRSFAYDATAMAYLRVAELGGTLTVDTSPDGITYAAVASVSDPSDFTFVRPSIQTHRGVSSPQYFTYVADVDGGTPTGAACPVAQLRDDFTGLLIGEQWARSEGYGGTLTAHDGIVDLATSGGGSVVGLGASTVYDLSDGEVFVEIPQVLASAASNTVELRVTTGAGDWVSWLEDQNTLTARAQLSNGTATSALLGYVPATMRWWKIAVVGGVVQWATSADGISWDNVPNQAPALAGIDRCDIVLTASSDTNVASDTRADNFDIHP